MDLSASAEATLSSSNITSSVHKDNFVNCVTACGGGMVLPNGGNSSASTLPTTRMRTQSTAMGNDRNKDMQPISPEEEEAAFNDLYGISTTSVTKKESAELISRKLHEMDIELQKIRSSVTSSSSYVGTFAAVAAYNLAEQQDRSYVENSKFRLTFLRAEVFEPIAAAKRMLRFFEEKLLLFGLDKLCKDIVLGDRGDDGTATLSSGFCQILPKRDRAGRKIILGIPNLKNEDWTLQSIMKAHYYLMMSILETEEDEKKGIVALMIQMKHLRRESTDTHPNGNNNVAGAHVDDNSKKKRGRGGGMSLPDSIWHLARLRSALPVRIACGHICIDNPRLKPIVDLVMMIAGSKNRSRVRAHLGAETECLYSLMTFGIPTSHIPISPDGTVRLDDLYRWTERRREIDARKNAQDSVHLEKGAAPMLESDHEQDDDVWVRQLLFDIGHEEENDEVILSAAFEKELDVVDGNEANTTPRRSPPIAFPPDKTSETTMKEDVSSTILNAANINSGLAITADMVIANAVRASISSDAPMMGAARSGRVNSNETIAGSDVDQFPYKKEEVPDTTMSNTSSSPPVRFSSSSHMVYNDNDVLLGRGRLLQKHPGNVYFRDLITSQIDKYNAAGKWDKTAMADEILQKIKQRNGRFLKECRDSDIGNNNSDKNKSSLISSLWVEIDHTDARYKVAYTFRTYRKSLKVGTNTKVTSTQSTTSVEG